DAAINKLAASIIDPRAEAWFKRVARYWTINIDKLQAPYEAPAVPRDERRGSKYNHEPSLHSYSKSGPETAPLWPAWKPGQGPPPNSPNVCQKCKGTGHIPLCRTCGGYGEVKM